MSDPEDTDTIPREELDELDRWVWDDPELWTEPDQPTEKLL